MAFKTHLNNRKGHLNYLLNAKCNSGKGIINNKVLLSKNKGNLSYHVANQGIFETNIGAIKNTFYTCRIHKGIFNNCPENTKL